MFIATKYLYNATQKAPKRSGFYLLKTNGGVSPDIFVEDWIHKVIMGALALISS
jgi:hypothetical protein